MDNRKVATTGTGFRDPRANDPRRKVPVSTLSDKPMWDILDSQEWGIHGEGLQNRTESQVGNDQMGGQREKGEGGERTDGSEMEGEEQNEQRRQGGTTCTRSH